MEGLKAKLRVGVLIGLAALLTVVGFYGLLKPIHNGCVMTYMYPTYIPISAPVNSSSNKYGLYLYHEGWKKINFRQHLKELSGVPVLFIPGNGGSYKQVRSIAKESHWAYTTGPLEQSFYQEALLTPKQGGVDFDSATFSMPDQYSSTLDWFAVDLEGERSAMDGHILKEHTEYVIYAIHRILDQYKESYDARAKEGAAVSGKIPRSVILVGHSMGGFVARAAIVHPHLRNASVETVVTLSTPHQSPPLALQPSLGYYYASINKKWQEGYNLEVSHARNHVSHPVLSNVVVISISGGINDYQVRSKLVSLDDIVPPTHGFMVSSTEMKNVWVSMEHQAILWCNQLVVQVSHTLLSLVDPGTGHPFSDRRKRLAVFTTMLRSGVRYGSSLIPQSSAQPSRMLIDDDGAKSAGSHVHFIPACPEKAQWKDDSLERDLHIQLPTVTVLAMDGRRRWLDIQKLGSNGKSHFALVTNLSPCYGIRIHLWPEKGTTSNSPLSKGVMEVTTKLAVIPSGLIPKQIEPGSQTEQPPPSAVFWLTPEDMRGFRFISISVAPRPTISGRPPPAASMAIGQFFNPDAGFMELSPSSSLLSMFSQKEMLFKEDHPIALNLSFTVSLGLLPVTLSLKTTGCGIRNSGLSAEEADDAESSRLCKLRCFPAVALAWDKTSGLQVYPNLNSETIIIDSAPALWNSAHKSEKTTVLLLVDPHCAYKASYSASITAAASRFLLLYSSKIFGLCNAVVFFALMRQARAWELDMPIPSMLTAVEHNLRVPLPFLTMTGIPLLVPVFSVLQYNLFPSVLSFLVVSLLCYVAANGALIIVILTSQMVFYVGAVAHIFFKKRWQVWERSFCLFFLKWFIKLTSKISSFKAMRVIRSNPVFVTALSAILLACFIHPSLGLSIVLISHSLCCHNALCSLTHREVEYSCEDKGNVSERYAYRRSSGSRKLPLDETDSPGSSDSYDDIQLDVFHLRHGLLILHLLATLMFGPSLVAWCQRLRMGESLPSILDSVLCIGVIFHGLCDSKPEFNFFVFPIHGLEVKSSLVYLLAGYFSFLSGLALAPYRVLYAMATIGLLSFAFRIIQRRNVEKGDIIFNTRKHSHKH